MNNMMNTIEIPSVEVNLADWPGAGMSERLVKEKAMEIHNVDEKGWKKLLNEDKIYAKNKVYQYTEFPIPLEFLNKLSNELDVDLREGMYDAVITNKKNPAYYKEVKGQVGGVMLEGVYTYALEVNATKPNVNTRKKKGITEANRDYVVTVTASPIPASDLDIPEPYKFDEDLYLDEIQSHIDRTYESHYSTNSFQATEFIIDAQHGSGFCMGNILKYAQRYGKKGDNDQARSDLMKIIHYAIIQLHIHDNDYK